MHILLDLISEFIITLPHGTKLCNLVEQQDKMQTFNVISNDYGISCVDTAYSTFSFICVCVCDHVWTIDGMSTKWIQSILFNRKIHFYRTYKNTMLMSKLQTLRNIQKNYKTRFFFIIGTL